MANNISILLLLLYNYSLIKFSVTRGGHEAIYYANTDVST